jgi:hypothetical protein
MASEKQHAWNNRTPSLGPRYYQPPKLTPAQRDEIRRRLGEGERPIDLAKEFGVSPRAISDYR